MTGCFRNFGLGLGQPHLAFLTLSPVFKYIEGLHKWKKLTPTNPPWS